MAIRRDSFASWVAILLIGLALTQAHADRVLLSVAAPELMREKHLSATQMGVLFSAFAWSFTLFQLPAGWLVDRLGPRKVLAIVLALWSLTCAVTGLGSSFAFLLGCRLFLGLFESPIYAAAHSTLAVAFTDRRRALATSIYIKGTSLGPAFGMLAGSFLMSHYGWSKMFVIFGLGSLITLVAWFIAAPKDLDKRNMARTPVDWTAVQQILRDRTVVGLSIGYFGFIYIFYVYVTWLPTYLSNEQGLSPSEVAWMASIPFLVALVAGPATGWLTDYLIHRGYSQNIVRKSAIFLGLLVAAAIIPAAYVSSSSEAAIFFVIALAGQSIAATNMLALPSAVAPKGHAGLIGSAQQMLGGLGGMLSPVLTGVIYDRTHSFQPAILCVGLMIALSAIGFLVVMPKIGPIELRKDARVHPLARRTPA